MTRTWNLQEQKHTGSRTLLQCDCMSGAVQMFESVKRLQGTAWVRRTGICSIRWQR